MTYALLTKWQIAVFLVSCCYLIMLILTLGLRPILKDCVPRKVLFISMLVYLIFQITLCLPVYFGVDAESIVKGINSPTPVWKFLWSPMASTVVIWLYLAHTVVSCSYYKAKSDMARFLVTGNKRYQPEFLMSGVVSIILCAALVDLKTMAISEYIDISAGLILASIATEIMILRWKFNIITLHSPILSWFIGTWLGAWLLSII